MKRITIKDVAQRSGVSISSVSRYLADPASINPISAVAVGKAIKELNYVPNPFAQNLKSDSTNVIAVIMPDIANEFFIEACKAMCSLYNQDKYLVMICDCDNDPEKEKYYVDEVLQNRVAGIALATCGGNTEYLKGIVEAGHRLVLFDRNEPDISVDCVTEDNYTAAYTLAKAMLEKGHRRFAILNGAETSVNMRIRLSGITAALAQAGIQPEEKYNVKGVITKKQAAQTLERLVADPDCPRCILVCNPLLLNSVGFTANQLGLRIPEDYVLAGFGVQNPKYIFPFPVPVVLQDPTSVGLKTGEMLLKRLRNKTKTYTPRHISLPTRMML